MMMKSRWGAWVALAIAGTASAQQVDPGLESYRKSEALGGKLASVGSDTLNNLMTFWAEEFKKSHPKVEVEIEGKGSSTAPPALTSGAAQLAPMSREMKPAECDAFEAKHGYKPTAIRTAVDALAVFVHKDNPLRSLTLVQLDAIFSKSRRRGGQDIVTWGQLGLGGEWADKPVALVGRNAGSGTHGFFKDHVLKGGEFKEDVREQQGSASVVLNCTLNKYAIGYSGIGYSTSTVRAVPLSGEDGGAPVAATAENAYSGSYPLSRFLYVYVARAPGKALDPAVREFISLICSKEGQSVVVKDGYFPLLATVVREDLAKIR